jgi:hypothetical protein
MLVDDKNSGGIKSAPNKRCRYKKQNKTPTDTTISPKHKKIKALQG